MAYAPAVYKYISALKKIDKGSGTLRYVAAEFLLFLHMLMTSKTFNRVSPAKSWDAASLILHWNEAMSVHGEQSRTLV